MRAPIYFTKMHGAGNDFVMLNGVRQKINPTPAFIRYLADRRLGIGADHVLLVEPPETTEADFKYRIFNCDGEEVEQCGNGARCFAVFVREEGLTSSREILVETKKALIRPRVESDGRVTVDMGCPIFPLDSIPFQPAGLERKRVGVTDDFSLLLDQEHVHFSVVSMGNPHAVIFVEDVDEAPVKTLGAKIEKYPAFPARVNVGFLECLNQHEGRIRVWERGAGETLACGTGACAAAVVGIQRGIFEKEVTLHARGGVLTIQWDGLINPNAHVYLTGPVQTVFNGSITLPEDIFYD